MKIYKYTLDVVSEQTLLLPIGAEFLSLQVQQGTPAMWFKVNPDAEGTQATRFYVLPTGQEFNYDPGTFLGTFQLLAGNFVGHVFWSKE